MARVLIPVTYTIRPEQKKYIQSNAGNKRDCSRWIRDAIDMRIERELKTLKALRQKRKAAERKREPKVNSGDLDPSGG